MTERATEEGGPLIVVGVSGRTGSRSALQWATDVAARVGGRVRAVMAWRPPRPPAAPGLHPPAVSSTGPDDPEKDAQQRLARLVAEAVGADHGVECVVERGGPVRVLLDASRHADLLVIDSPRAEKLTGVPGKTVAPRLVHRAECPVVVMPPGRRAGNATAGLRRAASRFATALTESAGTAGRAGIPPIPAPAPPPVPE
jgi:nucleotide-binding universal stress UspA family protein